MLTYPWFKQTKDGGEISELESFVLTRAPVMLATQQRFQFFLAENQKQVKNNAKLACIPSGMMGELLYLDYANIDNIELIGIDYDKQTLIDAKNLAIKLEKAMFTTFIEQDAWQINIEDQLDLISSNGLNIYEPDQAKITNLYRIFYKALKPGGKLVTSFLTYPPTLTDHCEWDFSKINMDDLLLQRILFADVIQAKWQSFSSSKETKEQLEQVGFKNIHFIYDDARLFPTVIAYK
jgi:SAM-dependent methyltransferase